MLGSLFAALAVGAASDRAWVAAAIFGVGALLSATRTLEQCSAATATIHEAIRQLRNRSW